MVIVYGTPGSRATRITWTLEEAEREYEYRSVSLKKGEGRTDSFLAMNAAGKVPVLCDGEIVVTESLAICQYLTEIFPDAGLAPAPGTPARAAWLCWSAFAVCELEQPLWTLAKHRFALPGKYRIAAIADTARYEFARAAAVLASRVGESEFLCGESFSTADVLTGHTLSWARNAIGELDDAGLRDYADRMLARPALARARAREQAESADPASP